MSRLALSGLDCLSSRLRRRLGFLTRDERDWVSRLEAAIADLPEPTRSVFRLIRNAHLNYGEAALELGLSECEIEAHVAQALRILTTVPRNRPPP